jgi:DMSO/TMAO reductase YedYZ molybdopterin-dependent catalytic subunit
VVGGEALGPAGRGGLKPEAKYIVFHCFDALTQTEDGPRYYESIDLIDARHPQTLLAYDMNGEILGVPHGAPLRLRVERQLGYKHAKYIKRIEAVESFDHIEGGNGGYWPDRGYEWYAGSDPYRVISRWSRLERRPASSTCMTESACSGVTGLGPWPRRALAIAE